MSQDMLYNFACGAIDKYHDMCRPKIEAQVINKKITYLAVIGNDNTKKVANRINMIYNIIKKYIEIGLQLYKESMDAYDVKNYNKTVNAYYIIDALSITVIIASKCMEVLYNNYKITNYNYLINTVNQFEFDKYDINKADYLTRYSNNIAHNVNEIAKSIKFINNEINNPIIFTAVEAAMYYVTVINTTASQMTVIVNNMKLHNKDILSKM